jgi:hypothetical protein
MSDTCQEDCGIETSEENYLLYYSILMGSFGNDLSILDIGIFDTILI